MENEYSNYIIAFLDILGFKTLVNHSESEEVLKIYKALFSDKEISSTLHCATSLEFGSPEEYAKNEILNRYNVSLNLAKVKVISDSIVVSTPDNYPESLAVVVDICNAIQQKLFNLKKPVLLRGAIAVGEIYLNAEKIFGKGLVKAYYAEEEYAVYPRIIISNEVTMGRKMTIKGIELPKDSDGYYRIDCIERYLNVYNAQKWEDIEKTDKYDKIRRIIDINLNEYCDNHIRQKYLWMEKVLLEIRRKIELGNGSLLVV